MHAGGFNAKDCYEAETPIPDIYSFVMEQNWTFAIRYFWQNSEHINSLDASMGAMALQRLIGKQIFDSHALFITGLDCVRPGMTKGRSRSVPILLRCRRLAALQLAGKLCILWAYIPSEMNPADKFTR